MKHFNKLVLVLSVLFFIACGENPNDYYEQALNLFDPMSIEEETLNSHLSPSAFKQPSEPVGEDVEKAVSLYQKASDLGLAEAQLQLGICYQFGIGGEHNLLKAFELFEKAAAQDCGDAFAMMAQQYGGKRDFDKMFEMAQKAADLNSELGYIMMASCYNNGFGCDMSKNKFYYWMEKAGESGSVGAQWCLATNYIEEENFQKVAYWAEKAVEAGLADAQTILGQMYLYGNHGIKKDEQKGLMWLQMAADQNDILAQVTLGLEYGNEYFRTGDAQKLYDAEKMFEKALENEYPNDEAIETAKESLSNLRMFKKLKGL